MKINSDRLWNNLMQMAVLGDTGDGGCNRQALTDLDMRGRALFTDWCKSQGLSLSYDAIGNMFARLEGANPDLPPLVIGSHLDTQPTGGKFDGVLGVLAGLEVVTRLREHDIVPARSIEVACWTNEEGARFAPAMTGSGVWAGALDLAVIRAACDPNGITLATELDRHGYSDLSVPSDKPIHAYLELHIEQGPVLEDHEAEIGVVTGAQGIRWFDLKILGDETHAGPTPMTMRRDPVWKLADVLKELQKIGTRDPQARATVGQIKTAPFSRNVVPGLIQISVDLRHPEERVLTEMCEDLSAVVTNDPDYTLTQIWHSPVVEFDAALVTAVREGAEEFGYSHEDVISGAGHDALMIARKAPAAMIFVPCRGGISHNPAERIDAHQAEAGANVLISAVMKYLL